MMDRLVGKFCFYCKRKATSCRPVRVDGKAVTRYYCSIHTY